MKIFRLSLLFLLFTYGSFTAVAQNFSPPLRIPVSLSANFGELRNNHFHSGLDYRTQQSVNKPVYSIGDGFISRINVSPGGYGLALYIDHPGGLTSVYGHLNSFSKRIADYIKQKQYEKAINIFKRLNLKYPEKSVYFADQIRFLNKLINNI